MLYTHFGVRTNRIESLTKAELRDQNERLRARLAEVEKRLEEETAGIGRALAKLPGVPIREQLEQALRESQTLLQAVLDSSPDAVYVKDRESRMLMANRTVLRNIGKPVDQVLGHRASEYYDTETGRPIREHDLRVLESGQVETVEETIPTQNGPRIFLSRKAPYRNAAGEIVGVLGISTDITDLKRVQESLRDRNAVLDGINRILASALDCETEEALARACLQVAMETTGSRFGFLGDINARGEVENLAVVHPGGGHQAPVLGGGGPVPGFHLRGHLGEQLAGGKGFFANNHAVPAHPMGFPSEHPSLPAFLAVPLVQGGKTTGVIGLGSRPGGFRQQDLETAEALAAAVVEVLTHLRAELAGRAAEQRFWQAQKLESLGLLAGGVAHDFNNLLVSILGNASIVRDMLPEDNPAGRYLDAVIGAGEQAATLTRQMLAYAGRGHFAVESISLSDLVRETMPLARASTDKRIRFDLETASNLPRLEADRGQMEQVLLNLVFNAAEAIGDSEGTIFIRTGPKGRCKAHTRIATRPSTAFPQAITCPSKCATTAAEWTRPPLPGSSIRSIPPSSPDAGWGWRRWPEFSATTKDPRS